jgi:hypothetical protein
VTRPSVWLLVGIIVLQTAVCVLSSHAVALVHPTVVSITGMAERVMVTDITICDEDGRAAPDSVDVVGRKDSCVIDSLWQFSRREHCNQPNNIWFDASLRGVLSYREWRLKNVYEHSRESNVISRRQPVVLPYEFNLRLSGYPESFYISRNNPDVRPELSCLIVGRSRQLLLTSRHLVLTCDDLFLTGSDLVMTRTHLSPIGVELAQRGNQQTEGEESVQKDDGSNGYFGSKSYGVSIGVFLLICVVGFLQGYKRFIYRGQLIGVFMVIGAILAGMTAMWLLVGWSSGRLWLPSAYWTNGSTFAPAFFHSESASASPRVACVLALTCSRPENVRVVPIIIARFEFSNIEPQIIFADLEEI